MASRRNHPGQAEFGWATQALRATGHLVSVDGNEASIDTQFSTFDVAGTPKTEGGWPAGTFGAQDTINAVPHPAAARSLSNTSRIIVAFQGGEPLLLNR
jgi:hypothetical protein